MSDTPETVDQKMGQAMGVVKAALKHLTSPPLKPGGETITLTVLGVDVPVYVRALTPAGVPWYEALVVDHVYRDEDALSAGQRAIGRALKRAAQREKAKGE